MQPMDYRIQVQSPFEGAIQGVQAGVNLAGVMDKQAEQQRQLELQRQMQTDLGGLAMKVKDGTAGAQDFASTVVKYPQLSEHFKRGFDMMSADQQQSRLGQATQVYAALNANKPEIAQQLLAEQEAAARNSGTEKDAQAAATLSKLISMSPETAKTSTGLMLSSVMGADKFTATFTGLGSEQRAQEKQPFDVATAAATAQQKVAEARNTPERLSLENSNTRATIRNIDSQIGERSQRLGLDRDKIQSEVEMKLYELGQKQGQLTDDAKKIVNDSTVAATTADQASGQMLDLATRMENEAMGSGLTAKGGELYKQYMGSQDAVTSLRQEYTRLRNTQAIKMLPPGPATDRDIDLAMKGFPDETADPKTMASFLRGMAKLNQYSAVNESAKAEWVNSVGHLGKPKTDITIDGVKIPAGTTFVDFARQYMPTKTEQRGKEQGQAQVPNSSYMKWLQSQGAK